MYDPQVIATLLEDEWEETNPAVADVMFGVDEYDPKKPAFQIICENVDLPKEEFIIDSVFRAVQNIKITVYLKPIRYAPDILVTSKVTFYKALVEIDRIIREAHYEYTAIEYHSLSWRSVLIPKGMGAQPEPLMFYAEKLMAIQSYVEAE